MIRVTVDMAGRCLTIDGHADAAPNGHDIICAGVSALVYAGIRAIESAGEQAGSQTASGHAVLRWSGDQATPTIEAIVQTLGQLARQYPKHISCVAV